MALQVEARPPRRDAARRSCIPTIAALAATYMRHFDVEDRDGAHARTASTDLDALRAMAGARHCRVVVQQPNYLGCLEDVATRWRRSPAMRARC